MQITWKLWALVFFAESSLLLYIQMNELLSLGAPGCESLSQPGKYKLWLFHRWHIKDTNMAGSSTNITSVEKKKNGMLPGAWINTLGLREVVLKVDEGEMMKYFSKMTRQWHKTERRASACHHTVAEHIQQFWLSYAASPFKSCSQLSV